MENISFANFRIGLRKQAYFTYVLAVAPLILLLSWIFYKQSEAAVPYHQGSRFWQWGEKIYYFFMNETPRMQSKASFTKIIWDFFKKFYNV